jgi:D-tyrosyl-tRNA(Tyr) deacylase
MRLVIQRCVNASCVVDGNTVGEIDKGFMILVGFKETDTLDDIKLLVKKTVGLRVFSDEAGKMNKSLKDVGGSILAISQFTLYGSCKNGNRPSFTEAMNYLKANEYYELYCNMLRENGIQVECGVFGADMAINLTNDGPVTIIIDSNELK